MEKNNIVLIVVLGLLIVLSAVQAFQLDSMKQSLQGGTVSVSSGTASSTPSMTSSGDAPSAPAALPSSIKDLPQMVGGC